MLSFNNNPALKREHVAQAEHHAAADILVSGTYGDTYGDNFRGCSVGCFAHDIDPESGEFYHEVVANARHLPVWLIRLQDSIFEGLPDNERNSFHVELAKRIPCGVNLEPVQHWIAIARIDRMLVTQHKALDAKHPHGVHEAIQQTIAALEKRAHEAAAGGNTCDIPTESAVRAARAAAWSAARGAESAESAERAALAAWQNERDALFAALDQAAQP